MFKTTYPLPHTLKPVDDLGTSPCLLTPGLPLYPGMPLLIAGPCTLESYEHTLAIGLAVKEAGATVLRGSIRKPRTSPYTFQGWDREKVSWHKEAQRVHGLLTETEVLDVRDVEITAEHVDILRIGARNMQNFTLLQEVSRAHRPVILKRHPSATIEEWLSAAEYILNSPTCPGVILCERGIRSFETSTRYTLDLNTLALLKEISPLPIIADPSHASGKRSLVAPLAKAAMAAGADGLIIEVHESPERALCDGKQHITPQELKELFSSIRGGSHLFS
nr:3-deoxy-7-phosphoheptulonate synthase [Chlamydia gallinacea]